METRYRRVGGQFMRGIPHLVVGMATVWVCFSFVDASPLTTAAALAVSVILGALWWYVLWPVSETRIVGTVYTLTSRYGTTVADLGTISDISTRWVAFQGSSVVIQTSDNAIEIPRTRRNREELLVIGDILRQTQPRLRVPARASRALGLADGTNGPDRQR